MSVPRIIERSIMVSKKPTGLKQYVITLPKEYAAELERKNIRSLLIVFNYGLAAFPNAGDKTEEAILTFLSRHQKLREIFMPTREEGR